MKDRDQLQVLSELLRVGENPKMAPPSTDTQNTPVT